MKKQHTLVNGQVSPLDDSGLSVSRDGIELPKVYITDDLFANETDGLDWTPSPIAIINDQDVEYLTAFAALNSAGKLESHAEWNMLMQSGALDAQGYYEVFWGADGIYVSPGYTGPLPTGGDFYNFFVLGFYPASYLEALQASSQTTSGFSAVPSSVPSSVPSPSESATASETEVFDAAYPPNPDVMLSDSSYNDGLPQGYFVNDSSLAVITMPQYFSYSNNARAFTDTIRQFLIQSQEAGLKRVIIDLQQNKGGQALFGNRILQAGQLRMLHALFFPSIEPIAPSRRRAHPMADVLGSKLTEYWPRLRNTTRGYRSCEWVVANRLNAETGRRFASWDDYFFSAAAYEEDRYTKQEEYNLTDTAFIPEAAGIQADNRASSQRYNADDMAILTDGLCSSACALFMELMHQQAGVRTVVVGGRPDSSPTQAAAVPLRSCRLQDLLHTQHLVQLYESMEARCRRYMDQIEAVCRGLQFQFQSQFQLQPTSPTHTVTTTSRGPAPTIRFLERHKRKRR
ncbi:hypothetical protein BDW62DRAFT_205276 [Aspergillus aurantiobrunneus]